MRINLVFLIITSSLLLPASFADQLRTAEPDDGISKGRYVTGGVVGSVVGFGVGHAIQKRYAKSHAWIFTATESAALAYIFSSTLFACDGLLGDQYDRCMQQVDQKVMIGSVVYWGFHIWEIFDVWTGVKVSEAPSSSAVLMPGLVNPRTPGLVAVVRF
jgi:hypothetical protein